jgi:ATP-binding cassette, subfamily B, multidrug efflux pump
MTTPPITTKTALAFLFSYLKDHRVSLAFGFVVLVLVDGLQLIIPRIIQRVLDTLGSSTYSEGLVWKSGLLIVLCAVFMVVLRYLWRMLIVKPSRAIEEKMRSDMFAHLERLSSPFFNRTRTGDLMALFVNDVGAIRMATGMALIGLFDAVFMSTMSLAFMVAISPMLTLIAAGPLPVIGILFVRSGRLIQNRFTAVQESFATVSTHTQESFSGIRVIKGFAEEKTELARLGVACDDYVARNMALVKVWGMVFPAITFMASLSYCLLILAGGHAVLSRGLSIGEFVSFSFYINLLVWPMVATGWVFNMIQRGIASAKRVLELLHTAPEVVPAVDETGEATAMRPISGDIQLRDCSFSFTPSMPDVLRSITLSIPAGSSVGIVGKPGSGKTTLASLLFHLYPVKRGAITVDDRDINDIPPALLRRSISYVPQDSFLFSETILHNICFGLGDDDRAAAEEAARKAAIHDDIMNFADGYDTRIGERGVTLSGGQKQRVALARALLTDAPVLILDDALSAVDAATEKRILDALRPSLSGPHRAKTALIIAHRISTVRQCDTIIVLEGGRIAEQGPHDTLIRNNGLYSTLYRLQHLHQGETP